MAVKIESPIRQSGWAGRKRLDFDIEELPKGCFQMRVAFHKVVEDRWETEKVEFFEAASTEDVSDTIGELVNSLM